MNVMSVALLQEGWVLYSIRKKESTANFLLGALKKSGAHHHCSTCFQEIGPLS